MDETTSEPALPNRYVTEILEMEKQRLRRARRIYTRIVAAYLLLAAALVGLRLGTGTWAEPTSASKSSIPAALNDSPAPQPPLPESTMVKPDSSPSNRVEPTTGGSRPSVSEPI